METREPLLLKGNRVRDPWEKQHRPWFCVLSAIFQTQEPGLKEMISREDRGEDHYWHDFITCINNVSDDSAPVWVLNIIYRNSPLAIWQLLPGFMCVSYASAPLACATLWLRWPSSPECFYVPQREPLEALREPHPAQMIVPEWDIGLRHFRGSGERISSEIF
ncbi:hypothetical protein TNIN_229131 [Trichonephila inaurata madagascariensis]|uniref:Uncharacterized protein n=1 Tax=Trichonephila inaurata madagascariensis TaxID=2747483 RepID=A0A8X6YR73_9ARAC|nr:hypothetical protein TNIN_229131 [Trichonephila inaurata madagascariensis]